MSTEEFVKMIMGAAILAVLAVGTPYFLAYALL